MPENGTVSRCAFWIRQQPLRVTAPMVIVKNSNHTPKCVSVAQDFGAPIGSNVGIGPGLPAQALGRQVPVETEKQLSLHPPLRGRPTNGRLTPFSLSLGW